jgi:16S rRNA (cytosine967-C5)-methyltransferase
MKNIPFRKFHLLELLQAYDQRQQPLDLVVHNYFRSHKALGAKDRAAIANTLFPLIRWKGLVDCLCEKPVTWEKRLEIFENLDSTTISPKLPLHHRVSFPKDLFEQIEQSHGQEAAIELCQASNGEAPLTIRINPLKTTRDQMLKKWEGLYPMTPSLHSPYGIVFQTRCNLFHLEEFKEGLFEMQDEGSQLLAELIQAKPGQLVLDFCAGSGGKTLAFAPRMENRGQIYLHDIRSHILLEAKKRLRRAGIQNAQTVLAKEEKLKKLKKRTDWVLVDAPCTGTGTLRRNPDLKWKYSNEMLTRLIGQQRTLFEQALSYLRPEGKIVYATCSILKAENESQVEHFCKTYNLQIEGDPFASLPAEKGMDGFFGAVMSKKNTS